MSQSKRIALGLAVGIVCGVFLGEDVAPLKVAADGFVKLLQMTVLPYVMLSIIASLGSLGYADARRLGARAGLVILALWIIAIGFALVMPLTFPVMESASFFSTTMVESRQDFDFVDLYIPANPFRALAANIVPAVVVFSFVLGIALIGVPQRQRLLEVLKVALEMVSRATRFVVRLTPIGIFAIAAYSSGTLSFAQIGRIQIYLMAYGAIALLLAFWILPGLVWAVTPIPIREVLAPHRDALLTAFIAGDLFIVLPALTETSVKVLQRHKLTSRDEHKLPETIVPASFNFPHSGKLLSLSFILFAGWFADADIPLGSYPRLVLAGLLSFFGQLNAAVPFLLDIFRIPADTNQLFQATAVINSRFGTLLAGVHTVVVALLGSAAIAGAIRFQPARLLRYGVVSLLLTAGAVGGLRALFATVLRPKFEGAEMILNLKPLNSVEDSVVLSGEQAAAPPGESGSVVSAVLARRVLRVGFFPNRIPYAFFNREGHLVGFDVELAHSLARELGVQARFIPLATDELGPAMASGRCDIIMCGVLPTPRRAVETLFSQPYADETLAFCVKDYRRHEFLTWVDVRRRERLVIAVVDLPHYVLLAQRLLPAASLIPVDPDDLKLDEKAAFDAYLMPAERGSIQTLLHPSFSVVVPQPDPVRFPLAYPLARHDQEWAQVVDTWIEGERKAGNLDALYRHWILGQSATPAGRRWSILKDVLHWRQLTSNSIETKATSAP